jgi:phospholipid-binding lipoprotein MlaA
MSVLNVTVLSVPRIPRIFRAILLGFVALVLAVLQGCAMSPNANPVDPWEPFNRNVSSFNEGLDETVLQPVATAYQHVTPQIMRTGVTNFFDNIGDVWSFVNNVLQLKPAESVETLFRVGVNTTVGIFGLVDVASGLRFDKHPEDFGQTLGYWGMPAGPYVVLPLFGPSTLRDSLALPVDAKGNLVGGVGDVPLRNSLTTLRLVDTRARYLRAGRLLDAAALDKYSFTRDAFLQRRRGLIRDQKNEVNWDEERYDLPETDPSPAAAKPSNQEVTPAGTPISP